HVSYDITHPRSLPSFPTRRSSDLDLVFTPHLLPVKRGILETIHVPLTRAIDRTTAEGIYDTVYADEPCVAVLHGALPSLKDVVRSEEHTSELQSLAYLVCRLLLEK